MASDGDGASAEVDYVVVAGMDAEAGLEMEQFSDSGGECSASAPSGGL